MILRNYIEITMAIFNEGWYIETEDFTEGSRVMSLLPMDLDILPPSDDRIFKVLLTSPDAEPVLMDLISAIIKRPVVGVVIRNNEIPIGDTDEKAARLDVNCSIDDGSQVDLEMQASHIEEDPGGEHKNLKGKSIYYLCDLHSSQPSKGLRRYDKLAQTFQVTFCSYTVFPNRSDYVNSFSMRHDEDNELLSDAICVVYVELSKLKEILQKPVGDMTDLEKWSLFLQYSSEPKYRETLNEVIASKEVLQMAGSLLMNISQDERERAVFRSRRMYQTDLQSNLATAEDRGFGRGIQEGMQKGIQKGIQEGIQKGLEKGEKIKALAVAQNALQMGMNIDDIVRLTSLPRDEIESLRNAH